MNSFSIACFLFVGGILTLCVIHAIAAVLSERGRKKIYEEREKERLEDLKHEKHNDVKLPYHTDHKPMVLQDAIFYHSGYKMTDYKGLVEYLKKDMLNMGRWAVSHDGNRLYNNCKYNMYYIDINFLRLTKKERMMDREYKAHCSIVKKMERKGYILDSYSNMMVDGKPVQELIFIHSHFSGVVYQRIDLHSVTSGVYEDPIHTETTYRDAYEFVN